ncbi:MAG: 16S rRNA (uracil(1498)-N(3))-methyltransferase [Galactobacter sp.]
MSRQCFLDPSLNSHEVGDTLLLNEAEARHAAVKRLESGEEIDVVDGAGTRYTCTVVSSGAPLDLRVDAVAHEDLPSVRTRLVQALAKGDRDLQAVETCVEIGVHAITPWQADRSIVRWKADRAAKAHAKWRSQVVAAVKQSRRAFSPKVDDLVTTKQLTAHADSVTKAGGLVLVLHEDATTSISTAVGQWLGGLDPRATVGEAADSGHVPPEVVLIVGPEGGIAASEVSALQAAGAVPVLVGHHVLRASTAGAVGLVLIRSLLGDYD